VPTAQISPSAARTASSYGPPGNHAVSTSSRLAGDQTGCCVCCQIDSSVAGPTQNGA